MARRPDDLALLALIERPLADAALIEQPLDDAALASRLDALDEDVRREVAQMRRNRELLAGLAAPELPRDFVAGLAGMMEPPAPIVPGTGRRGALLRLVDDWMGTRSVGRAAAGLSLAACAGAALATVVWITLGRGGTQGGTAMGTDGDHLASGMSTSSAAAPVPTSGSSEAPTGRSYAADAELHHPVPSGVGQPAHLADAGRTGRPSGREAAAVARPVDLSNGALALVIRTDRSASGMDLGVDALRRAVEASSPKDAALVRNVTYSEAGDLEMRVRASARDGKASPPAMASGEPGSSGGSSGGSSRGSMGGSTERPRVVVDPTLADATLGEHLAGVPSAAAAPELQLALSDDGFTHSVTIPVERLRDLVMALAFDETVRMQIGRRETMAPDRLGAARDPASNAWQRWKDATAVLEELERSLPRGSLVVVAARVQQGSK